MTASRDPVATVDSSEERVHAPVSMEAAVGYDGVDCAHQAPVAGALVLKNNRIFMLVNEHGNVTPAGRCGLGLFQDDTRILSQYALRFGGAPPLLLSSHVPRLYRAQIDLAINDVEFGGSPWDPKNCIHVRRELVLDERLYEQVTLTNYLTVPIDFSMELHVGADFADIFEVRGWHRERRGQFYAPRADGRSIRFAYRGCDDQLVESAVEFGEAPTSIGPRGASWRFQLGAKGRTEVHWRVESDGVRSRSRRSAGLPIDERCRPMEVQYRGWRADCSSWSSDVETFDETLSHAIDDLRALYLEGEDGPIISAGIPWYSAAFGRDSIITSLQTLPLNPQIAVDTLRYLARYQGTHEDLYTEEQPGKIMHELRRGELARSGDIPHVPYYGTIDATPLWLVLLHETWRWTGDEALVRELLPNAERAVEWIDRYGDVDGDGFVEYAPSSSKGLVNQGWKDSSDGVPFPDGRLPQGPIALVEVQGYVADAKLRTAALLNALGYQEKAAKLREQAVMLGDAVRKTFWLEELGTFALALDGAKRPLPTVTSNAAHLLWSRVPSMEQASRLAGVLLSPEMFSGWGIRTLSAAHAAFNPMSYHNGSVWPHDNAIAVLGLAMYGHAADTLPLIAALHEAAVELPSHRLPELFCGMPRAQGMCPVLYPVSCSPQAWASAAMFMFLQAVTGLLPDAPTRVLHIRNPVLPPFLSELTIMNLRIGGSRVALQFRRHRERTLANLLGVEGEPLQVRIELS